MRTSGLLVACSLALGGGLWIAVSAFRQPRPRLDRAMTNLRRPSAPELARTVEPSTIAALGSFAERNGAAAWAQDWARPLRLVNRSVPSHLGLLVIAALAGFVAPTLVLGILQWVGVVSIGIWVPLLLALAGGVIAPVVVHSDAMSRSADVAVDLRHQLGAYLDMVTMLLAGNTGYEGALDQAARAGDGLLFRELRRRMREAGTTGQSLVRALERVADDYGIVELEQVAATATLSAAEGAPVARSLAAKCATLRSTLAAEQEADARVRNDKVTPPLVAMALLFMALIIYPALNLG
jgi:hypothetical protein